MLDAPMEIIGWNDGDDKEKGGKKCSRRYTQSWYR